MRSAAMAHRLDLAYGMSSECKHRSGNGHFDRAGEVDPCGRKARKGFWWPHSACSQNITACAIDETSCPFRKALTIRKPCCGTLSEVAKSARLPEGGRTSASGWQHIWLS